jgi:predicted amidophosphoribosyltransferase
MSYQASDAKKQYCSVCGEPAADIICPACKAKIQGEAAHKKQQIEKEGKTDSRRR